MSKIYKSALIAGIVLILFSATIQAQEQSWNWNFKGGIMLPGTVTIEGFGDADTELGWIVNTAFDALVAEKFSMGGYLFYSGITEAESGESYGANVLSIGGALRGRFKLQGGIQLRPGIVLAYQSTTGDAFDDLTGLNIGLSFDVVFPLKGFNAIVGELGFMTQPSGGNEDVNVTWAPIFYITVGYEIGG